MRDDGPSVITAVPSSVPLVTRAARRGPLARSSGPSPLTESPSAPRFFVAPLRALALALAPRRRTASPPTSASTSSARTRRARSGAPPRCSASSRWARRISSSPSTTTRCRPSSRSSPRASWTSTSTSGRRGWAWAGGSSTRSWTPRGATRDGWRTIARAKSFSRFSPRTTAWRTLSRRIITSSSSGSTGASNRDPRAPPWRRRRRRCGEGAGPGSGSRRRPGPRRRRPGPSAPRRRREERSEPEPPPSMVRLTREKTKTNKTESSAAAAKAAAAVSAGISGADSGILGRVRAARERESTPRARRVGSTGSSSTTAPGSACGYPNRREGAPTRTTPTTSHARVVGPGPRRRRRRREGRRRREVRSARPIIIRPRVRKNRRSTRRPGGRFRAFRFGGRRRRRR